MDGTGSGLYLRYLDEEIVVDPDERLDFGRAAQLSVDKHNPFLHRVLGQFSRDNDSWWLTNLGSNITISLVDPTGPTSTTIGPGRRAAITHPEFVVRFTAGPTGYELEGSCDETDVAQPQFLGNEELDDTLQWGVVSLNDEQRQLLTALCHGHLTNPGTDPPIPPSRQITRELGWSITKFNRKLDHLCDKFARAGVPGLRGDLGEVASDRRKLLVRHSLQVGLISLSDLELIDVMDTADGT